MKASVVDLRKNMKSVTRALERNEEVTLLSHGVAFATVIPISASHLKRKRMKVSEHPFFGAMGNDEVSVSNLMKTLRGPRFSI